MQGGRDFWLEEECSKQRSTCPVEWMHAESPLFTLYTSGSTGKPKGVLHTTGGYLVYAAMTHKLVFDLHEDDVYMCAADIGWVTGHSYIVYGPLANGATTVMFESIPVYPDAGRYWQVVDDLGVTIFYTAPTALRAIAREGDSWVKKYKRSVAPHPGERGGADQPGGLDLVPRRGGRRALRGGRYLVADGDRRHPDHAAAGRDADQTGLGDASLLRHRAGGGRRAGQGDQGQRRRGEPLPQTLLARSGADDLGRSRACFRDLLHDLSRPLFHRRRLPAGRGRARLDHRPGGRRAQRVGPPLGTAEVESALVADPAVAEAAVVGYPHDIKGTGIFAAYAHHSEVRVVGCRGARGCPEQQVREAIGAIATPDRIVAPGLPKTRSANDMRRILRKIAAGDTRPGWIPTPRRSGGGREARRGRSGLRP